MPAGHRALRLFAAVAAVATIGAVAGDGEVWLCVPLTLALAAAEPTAREGWFAGTAVLAVAAAVALVPGALVAGFLSLAVLTLQRARLERERDAMRRFALRDPLTGLANRRALDERLRNEVSRHARQRQRFAVLALDLDGFKGINDRFGHDTGDELLCEVADALRGAVRGQDAVARMGGDEFCIVAPQTEGAGVDHLIERVLSALAGITAGVTGVSGSVGAAVFPDDAEDPAGLLAAADAAALDVKRRSRSERRRAA